MKEITVAEPKIMYQCEGCNKTYAYQYSAEECERRHIQEVLQENCKHLYEYNFDIDVEEYSADIGIIRHCTLCNISKLLI